MSISKTLKQVGAADKQLRRAATLSKTGMDKSQVYGSSAVGVGPKTTSIQKSNLAVATGTLYQGVSRTLAIVWMYGPEAQPDTRNPLLALRAWLRFLDTADVSVAAIEKAWCRRYASLQARFNADDPNIWDSVTSAMSASILHLIHLGVTAGVLSCVATHCRGTRG